MLMTLSHHGCRRSELIIEHIECQLCGTRRGLCITSSVCSGQAGRSMCSPLPVEPGEEPRLWRLDRGHFADGSDVTLAVYVLHGRPNYAATVERAI